MRHSHWCIVLSSAIYNVLFYANTIVLMIVSLPVLFMRRQATLKLARLWSRLSVWMLRVICGTELEFRGLQNIPAKPVVIAAKHQSFLETLALTIPIEDFSYVLKRELMRIPLFGWLLRSAEQVGIDRKSGRAALLQILDVARRLLSEGRCMFIFPEGTRRPVGAPPDYKGGVGFIYDKANAPVLPVALNTGLFWPRRSFLRMPGPCVIEFLPVIEPGLDRATFMRVLEEQIETSTNALITDARMKSPWLARYAPQSHPVMPA